MSDRVTVSIILPVYNHAVLLERALAAIERQTRPPDEIVIVDDASSDDSALVAEAFRDRIGARIAAVLLRNPVNLGVNGTLNHGLAHVTGAWVCCTAADDWLEPRYVEQMAAAAARFGEARIVTSRLAEYFEDEDRLLIHDGRSESGLWYAGEQAAFIPPDDFSSLLERGHVAVPVNASLIRTDALREVGGYDAALKWHADWFAAYAIALRYGLAVVPEQLTVFRLASGTFSGDNVRHAQRQSEVCAAILSKLRDPGHADTRAALKRTPSPFAPFVRHMLPAIMRSAQDRDLRWPVSRWWLGEVMKGRRPGPLKRLMERIGLDTAPRAKVAKTGVP